MNIERAAMRGKKAEAEEKRGRLRAKINGIRDALRMKLNPALYAPEDIEMVDILQQTEDLHGAYIDLMETMAEVARLERELK